MGFTFINTYLSPHKPLDVISQISTDTQITSRIIIAGDFNVHLPGITNHSTYNKRDYMVSNWITANNLTVHNTRNSITWSNTTRGLGTTVDYTMSRGLGIREWNVGDCTFSASDHHPISHSITQLPMMKLDISQVFSIIYLRRTRRVFSRPSKACLPFPSIT